MTLKAYRITTTVLALVCGVLLILLFVVQLRANRIRSEIRCARDIAWAINSDRKLALKHGVPECISYLEKHQLADESFRNILADYVEEERRRCVSDIINHLRSLTGKDLGDDPASWIQAHETNCFGVK